MKKSKNLGKSLDLVSAWVRSDSMGPSRNLKVYVGEDENGYGAGDILDANYVIGMLKEIELSGEVQGGALERINELIEQLQETIAAVDAEHDQNYEDANRKYDELLTRVDNYDQSVTNEINEIKQVVDWNDAQ